MGAFGVWGNMGDLFFYLKDVILTIRLLTKVGCIVIEIQRLKTEAELNEILKCSKEAGVFIFKHSTTCPISANAYEEVKKFSDKGNLDDMVIGIIYVIEDRPLSQAVTERFGIKHESPQVLYIKEGTHVVWHASHWKITEGNLEKAKQI